MQPSLSEVHSSVATSQRGFWKRLAAFSGPAYLVSVGYMDPGNWATDLAGGAGFGYRLLWVLVVSNAMAILLQTLSARLGIVNGRDLAQACREAYPKPVTRVLWVLTEIAIAACDLAELLGAAIGLQLLFGLPLIYGVMLTAADTLVVLWLNRYGIRTLEWIVLGMVLLIGACFAVEIGLARPDAAAVARGLIPSLDGASLYIAVAMLGATVMPHNLYLHSALVQTRRIGTTEADKRDACRFNLIDSTVALNLAMFVNAGILILAGTVFYTRGIAVTEIQQAQQLLSPLLGTTLAGLLFGVALLAAGQSSTITGTLAGQIVMEGFIALRMRPWLRRIVTRMMAVIPAVAVIAWFGERSTYQMLVLSQVVLSLQLPFAVIPLVRFTSDPARMGGFANALWVRLLAWTAVAVIVGLNTWLVVQTVPGWLAAALLTPAAGLLAYVGLYRAPPRLLPELAPVPAVEPLKLETPVYRSILVPLDRSSRDRAALAHAASLARIFGSTVHLLHVEEDATSQVYGSLAATAEIRADRQYLDAILESLRAESINAELIVVYSANPGAEIITCAKRLAPDLIVMGAHGHKGFKDMVFGATINAVRHALAIPVLVVQSERTPSGG